MSTVKIGLRGLPATGTVAKAQGIHDAMDGNAAYPTPTPTLAVLQTAIATLAAANAAVDNNGGRSEHQARRVAEKALRALLKQLAGYVQMASGGDENTILSSGFTVVKRGAEHGEPNPPLNVNSRYTTHSGRVALKWTPEAGVDMYHVFMSTKDAPFEWKLVGTTTKSRFDLDGLTPRDLYWLSVTAINAAGESSLSEPARCMAAA